MSAVTAVTGDMEYMLAVLYTNGTSEHYRQGAALARRISRYTGEKEHDIITRALLNARLLDEISSL